MSAAKVDKSIHRIRGYQGVFDGRAIVLVDNRWLRTSPVKTVSVHGGIVYIETQNSVYTNAEEK